jgi:hypothetical protein
MKSSSDLATSRVPIASVRPSWADWHVAHVPAIELCDLHWDQIPGRASECVLYGFMSSDAIVAGDIPDTGGSHRPHNIRVCILPEDNDRHVFNWLVWEAGPRPSHPRMHAD